MKKKNILFLLCCLGWFFVLLLSGCKKEEVIQKNTPDAPFNPYDTITHTPPTQEMPKVDSASFMGLHTFIFSKSCAQPACHDGSFEPDFRTVESAYNSL